MLTCTSRAAARPALAAWLFTAALPALAQENNPRAADEAARAETPTIIVTGQRQAEIRAVEVKRESLVIQDSIASTDVARLPDQNVAEAVKRLPGVTVANDQGEGRYVIIRGVDPNLANVSINNQTAPAPEPGGRQVKLDNIPASLIGRVDVIKSLTPDRDANAIAGEVNISTLTAFDRDHNFFYARGAVGTYDLNGRNPAEAEGTFGARFGADRQFGIVLSGNYSFRPISSQNLQGSVNWRAVGNAVLPDDFRLRPYYLVRQRSGAVLNFDWRPQAGTQLYLRALYASYGDNEVRDQFRVELPGLASSATALGVQPNQSGPRYSFTGGRATRFVRRRVENDQTWTVHGGGKHEVGGVKLLLEAAYSRAEKIDPLRSEFQFRTGSSATTGIAGTIDVSGRLPFVDPNGGNARAYDPSYYSARQVTYDQRQAVEDLFQIRGDAEFNLDPIGDGSTVKTGAKFIRRIKKNNRDLQQFILNGFTLADTTPRDDGTFLYDGQYRFGPKAVYDNVQAFVLSNPARRVLDPTASLGNSLVNDYDVREDIIAGYAMATLRFGRLTAIPGVRVEATDGNYKGKSFLPTSSATQGFNVTTQRDYVDVFPGLNLRFDATRNLVVRAAGTTAIGRPNYANLAPFVQVDPGAVTVNQGNPNLKPFKSQNGDVSIEYYIGKTGVISVAGFYKHLDNPIFTAGSLQTGTFAGTQLTNALVTQPINVRESEIYGFEVNLQAQLNFLPSPLDGFGVNLNYAHTDGNSTGVPSRAGSVPNFLQSKDIGTAQIYWQKGRFELRAAYSYRSAYLDTLGTSAATDQYTDGNGQLDVRASFAVFPQLVAFGEAVNVTDASWRRYVGFKNQLIENERYGYTLRAGIQLALGKRARP
ncbi:MAG: TonB-dependent receptor [Sphingomonadaceae bacterium]|nr:TonB-dependent receptor [Sphingomonadaceae bacterium]